MIIMKNILAWAFLAVLPFNVFALDSDGDGYSDEKEILLGTDPNVNEYVDRLPEKLYSNNSFLNASQTSSPNEVSLLSILDGKFIIGRRNFKLAVMSDAGTVVSSLNTSSFYTKSNSNLINHYATYPVAVSPDERKIVTYSPITAIDHDAPEVGISEIELFDVSPCSGGLTKVSVVKIMDLIPGVKFKRVPKIIFLSDDAFLISTELGVFVIAIKDGGMVLSQEVSRTTKDGAFMIAKSKNTVVIGGKKYRFDDDSNHVYLLNDVILFPGWVVEADGVGGFYTFSKNIMYMSTYQHMDENAVVDKSDANVVGDTFSNFGDGFYTTIRSQDQGSLNIYSYDGVRHGYIFGENEVFKMQGILVAGQDKKVYLVNQSGTHAYSGFKFARKHADVDGDGVMDIDDNYPLDPTQN